MNRNGWILLWLLMLTLVTALLSVNEGQGTWVRYLILFLFGIKFLLVSFGFMKMTLAHRIWKTAIVGYLVVFMTIVLILLG